MTVSRSTWWIPPRRAPLKLVSIIARPRGPRRGPRWSSFWGQRALIGAGRSIAALPTFQTARLVNFNKLTLFGACENRLLGPSSAPFQANQVPVNILNSCQRDMP
jgi:hypothetical protein